MDWRNTLEVQDFLPDYNRVALGKAMRAADIHVISWVGSEHREHTATAQLQHHPSQEWQGWQSVLGKEAHGRQHL